MRITKQNKGNFAMLPATGIGVIIALAITMIMASIGAIFISNEYMAVTGIKIAAITIQVLSTFIGSFIAGKIVCNKKALTCCIVGGIYYLILVSIAMLFFDGISGSFFICLAAGAIACFVAVYLCTKEKSASVRKRKNRRSR